MLVTALAPIIGYDKASQLAHFADENNLSLEKANEQLNLLSNDDFQTAIDPYKMAGGGRA